MKRILIIDDEKLIRDGIKAIINRKYGDVYECSLCSDGLEAIEILKNEKIFLVITDIRMPECDGITLLKKLKAEKCSVPVIVLSGYDQFNYAVEALRYGAKDYLLKPIQRQELYNAIEKIEKEYEVLIKDSDLYNQVLIQEEISDKVNVLLLNEHIDGQKLKEELGKIFDRINEQFYYILTVYTPHSKILAQEELRSEYEIFINNVIECNTSYHVFIDRYNNLNLVASDMEIIENIKNKIFNDNIYNYFVSLSESTEGYENFKKAYNKSYYALKSKMFKTSSKNFIYYKDVENGKNIIKLDDNIYKLFNLLGTKRTDEFLELYDFLFNEEYIFYQGVEYLEQSVNELIKQINRYVIKNLEVANELNKKIEQIEEIFSFTRYRDYYSELKALLIHVDELLYQMRSAYGDKSFINKAIEYIDKNYAKDISLAVVSNAVSMNYSYFSQVFKEYTGENFVNYLKKRRVEEAQKLLNDSNLKIYEISSCVGFTDSKQFTKAFKSITGITPVEYREKQLLNRG